MEKYDRIINGVRLTIDTANKSPSGIQHAIMKHGSKEKAIQVNAVTKAQLIAEFETVDKTAIKANAASLHSKFFKEFLPD